MNYGGHRYLFLCSALPIRVRGCQVAFHFYGLLILFIFFHVLQVLHRLAAKIVAKDVRTWLDEESNWEEYARRCSRLQTWIGEKVPVSPPMSTGTIATEGENQTQWRKTQIFPSSNDYPSMSDQGFINSSLQFGMDRVRLHLL